MKRVEVYLGANLRHDPKGHDVKMSIYRRLDEVLGDVPTITDTVHNCDYAIDNIPHVHANSLVSAINRMPGFCSKVVDLTD